MIDAANETNRSKVRDILGSFLFQGDEVDKFVRVLSGGERNRLALAKMLLQPFNLLVMDEPTNHLDIKSKNVLKQALHNFNGTLIVVSHDRDFLQGLTTKVYEFKDQKTKEHLGDIDYFLEKRKVSDFRSIEKKNKIQTVKKKKVLNTPENNLLKKKLDNIESKIFKIEKEISIIDKNLLDDYTKTVSQTNFFSKYESKKKELELLMNKWEMISGDFSS